MKSREQKQKEVGIGKELLDKSNNLVFTDFSGVGVQLIQKLKNELVKSGAKFRVIKKRLLRVALKQKGIDFDTKQFDAQLGTIFLPHDLSESAGIIYKFSDELKKGNKDFRILGAYDLHKNAFISAEDFTAIAQLPTRDVLLAQLVGVLSGPMRALAYILDQVSKIRPNQSPSDNETGKGETLDDSETESSGETKSETTNKKQEVQEIVQNTESESVTGETVEENPNSSNEEVGK
jgi:large subunit ribosomal protein L10